MRQVTQTLGKPGALFSAFPPSSASLIIRCLTCPEQEILAQCVMWQLVAELTPQLGPESSVCHMLCSGPHKGAVWQPHTPLYEYKGKESICQSCGGGRGRPAREGMGHGRPELSYLWPSLPQVWASFLHWYWAGCNWLSAATDPL